MKVSFKSMKVYKRDGNKILQNKQFCSHFYNITSKSSVVVGVNDK